MAMITAVSVKFIGDASGLKGAAKQAETAVDGVAGKARQVSTSVAGSLRSLGTQMQTLGQDVSRYVSLPAAAALGGMTKSFTDFEVSMNRVRAISQVTGKDYERLEDRAKEMGLTTRYTAGQAADAMGYLALAGFNVNQMYDAMPAVMQLAAAANMDVGQAADITTNIVFGYGQAIEDLGRTNDILTKTMTRTNTDLTSLGVAFKYAGPVLKAAGIEFTEASAAIGLLGNAGIQGSTAGTSLRQSVARLLSPTKEMSGIMEELGLNVVTADGKIQSLTEVLAQLERSGATTGQVMELFGVRAGPAMLALLELGGAEKLKEMTAIVADSEGLAGRVADIQMEGVRGNFLLLKSAVEGFAIAVFESGLDDLFVKILRSLTDLFRAMAELPDGAKLAIGGTLAALSALGPGLIMVGTFIKIFGGAFGVLHQFSNILPRITKGSSKFAGMAKKLGGAARFMITPWGIVIGIILLLVAAFVIAYKKSETFRNIVTGAVDAVKNAFQAFVDFLERTVLPIWEGFVSRLRVAWSVFKAAFRGSDKDWVGHPVIQVIQDIGETARRVFGFVQDIWSQFTNALMGNPQIETDNPVLNLFAKLGRQARDIIIRTRELWDGFMRGLRGEGQGFGNDTLVNFFFKLGDAVRKAMEWWEATWPKIKAGFDKVAEAVGKFAEWIGPKLTKFLEAAAIYTILGIIGVIVAVVVAAIAIVAAVIISIVLAITWFIDTLKKVGDFIGAVINIALDMFDTFRDVWSQVSDFAMKAWDKFGEFFDNLKGSASDLKDWLTAPFEDEWKRFKSAVRNRVDDFGMAFYDLFDAVRDRLDEIFSPILDWFGDIGTKILDKISGPFNVIKDTVSRFFSNLFGNLFKGGEAGESLGDRMVRMYEEGKQKLIVVKDAMVAWVTGIVDAVKAGFTSTIDGIVSLAQGIYDKFKVPLDLIAAAAVYVWETIKNGLTLAWETIKGIFGVAWDWLRMWWDILLEYILGFIRSFADIIRGDWGAAFEHMKDTVWNAFQRILEFFDDLRNRIIEWMVDLGKVIAEQAKDFLQFGKDIGTAIFDGIKDALSGFGDWVSEKLLGPLEGVISKIGSIFGMNRYGGADDRTRLQVGGTGDPAPVYRGTSTIDRTFAGTGAPGRALGGAVSAMRPYLVGERGPELFMPSGYGSIMPNHRMPTGGGGETNYTINVSVGPGSNPGEVGRQIVEAIRQYERRNGTSWRGAA
jgi:TP901 family phage tail tape measure protein